MVVYWFNEMVIFFIVVVYYRVDDGELNYQLYVVVFDELSYDKVSVCVFNKVILERVKEVIFVRVVYYCINELFQLFLGWLNVKLMYILEI